MNEFLPDGYSEQVTRLVVGLEPIDALLGGRLAARVDLAFDGDPLPAPAFLRRQLRLPEGADVLRRVERHDSCRYAVVWSRALEPAPKSPLKLRFDDRLRRYVPRRFSYALPDPTDPTRRVRRPAFYPGAAYGLSETATGLRGRVVWKGSGDRPVRWARVDAFRNDVRVGTAHGDDRGEFLLVLTPVAAAGLTEFPEPPQITVKVTVRAAPPAVPSDVDLPARDPLWDLPLEEVPLNPPDEVSPGEKAPPSHLRSATRDVVFRVGMLRTDEPKFELT